MADQEISGVYETFRSFGGEFPFLPLHQARLQRSCGVLEVKCPDLAEIIDGVRGRITEEMDARLRVDVFRDGRFELSTFERLPRWHGSFLHDEVWPVKVVEVQRPMPGVKSIHTEGQATAREQALEEGFKEVLLVNGEGFVTEGGITNVWFVSGDKIVTPDSGMLPGIARGLILRACQELGIEVEMRAVRRKELGNFDAIFLSNSIRGIIATDEGDVPAVMQQVIDRCTQYAVGGLA